MSRARWSRPIRHLPCRTCLGGGLLRGPQIAPTRLCGEHFWGFRRGLPETRAPEEVGYPEFIRDIFESVRLQKDGCCGTLLEPFPPGHGELLPTILHHLPRCGQTQVWW